MKQAYTMQFFNMAADTKDFRSSGRLLLVKRLSQATCCTAHMLNSGILYSMYNRAKGKKAKHLFTDRPVRVCLILQSVSIHEPCNRRCEKTFECQTRDLSIQLSTSDLISLSAEGIASFICLHNCRPACLCVWHMVVKSTALFAFQLRETSLNKSPFSVKSSCYIFASEHELNLLMYKTA